jgi:hypothetical protein
MKLPARYIRILVQLFCLLGIMSCQTRQPETASPTNQGKPDSVSTSDVKSMDHAKDKM